MTKAAFARPVMAYYDIIHEFKFVCNHFFLLFPSDKIIHNLLLHSIHIIGGDDDQKSIIPCCNDPPGLRRRIPGKCPLYCLQTLLQGGSHLFRFARGRLRQ